MDKIDHNRDRGLHPSASGSVGKKSKESSNSKQVQPPPQGDTITLAGETLRWKDVQLFMICPGDQVDEQGRHHLKIVPYQGDQLQGAKTLPPIVLFHGGHLFYAEKDGQTFQDACADMQREDPEHIVVQVYNQQDFSVHGPTCCHALTEVEFLPVTQLPLFLLSQVEVEQVERQAPSKRAPSAHDHKSSSLHAPTHPFRKQHRAPKEEEEDTKAKGKEEAELLVDNGQPTSLEMRVESTTEWIEKSREQSHEAKKERIKEELRKEDLGQLDAVRPVHENSVRYVQQESNRSPFTDQTPDQATKLNEGEQLQNKVRFSSPG